MKNIAKKVIILSIIIIAVTLLNTNSKVQAYSGEIDPKDLITLPTEIKNNNGVGTGTISVSDNSYTISYQKIDISETTLSNITSKAQEMQKYGTEQQKTINEEKAKTESLKKKYEDLKSSTTAKEADVEAAKNAYNTEVEKYNKQVSDYNSKMATYKKEYYALFPTYTSNWTKTTNSPNNVSIDFSNYTGKANIALWAKIENGTNTYYDVDAYTTEIKSSTSSNVGEFADFSNAKYTVTRSLQKVYLTISNVKNIDARNAKNKSERTEYCIFIRDKKEEPEGITVKNIYQVVKDTSDSETKNANTNTNSIEHIDVTKYNEVSKDYYLYIYEVKEATDMQYNFYDEIKLVVNGKKLDKLSNPVYTDAFYSTFAAVNETQIVSNFIHDNDAYPNRKIKIKIGKIDDTSILRKIRDKDSSGFSLLQSYAQNDKNSIASVATNSSGKYNIEYRTEDGKENFDLYDKITDKEYYYLYFEADDENGKFIPAKGTTLAQANKYVTQNSKNWWTLFFYGDESFKWADFGDDGKNGTAIMDGNKGTTNGAKKDNTVAPNKIPQTGVSPVVSILTTVFVLLAVVSVILYRKNRDIN